MGYARGFDRVASMLKKFLEEHGYYVRRGAWLDIYKDGKLYCDLQVGHYMFFRAPRRGARYSILYMFAEGRLKPESKYWLREYDYILVPTEWLRRELEKLDLNGILMHVGIDTKHFEPKGIHKWIDVLNISIWESSWDNRKFAHKVHEVAFPYTYYVHTRPTLPYEMMPYLYSSSRVYLSLSACEGTNIPVIEANACGVPVVGNAEPSTREYAYGVLVEPVRVYDVEDRGILYTYHEPDIEKIREKLHALLKDEVRLRFMSMEARKHALRFDYRETFKVLLEILV